MAEAENIYPCRPLEYGHGRTTDTIKCVQGTMNDESVNVFRIDVTVQNMHGNDKNTRVI